MTIIIIIATLIISLPAFNRAGLMAKLDFNPYMVYHRKEWYRILSHGFLHANWPHLIINMYVLYVFGSVVEHYYIELEHYHYIKFPELHFLILYIGGIIFSVIKTLFQQKDNYNYSAVGASGAVSAIVFSFIFFAPWQKILFFFIIPIPAIIFGILYLIYSQYMSKQNFDNINHDAHFWGAIFGFIYPIIIEPKLFLDFINKIFP